MNTRAVTLSEDIRPDKEYVRWLREPGMAEQHDGRVTDSQGRTVDFKNTIIIMTSNLGSSIILDSIEKDGKLTEQAEKDGQWYIVIDFEAKGMYREFKNQDFTISAYVYGYNDSGKLIHISEVK